METSWAGRRWSLLNTPTDLSILVRQLEQVFRMLLNGLLFFFALVGLLLGGRELLGAIETGELLDALLSRNWSMGAFWFGLLCASYVAFRIERERTSGQRIPDAKDEPSKQEQQSVHDIWGVSSGATQKLLEQAYYIARHDGDRWLDSHHILQALAERQDVGGMFFRLGVHPRDIRARAHQLTAPEKQSTQPRLSVEAQHLLHQAFAEATNSGHGRIQPFHLFSALTSLEDRTRDLLETLGLDDRMLREGVAWMDVQERLRRSRSSFAQRASRKPKGAIDRGYTAAATPILNRFSTDLTAAARRGVLPLILGRETELSSLWRLFESRQGGVLLIGEPSIGKTGMLEAVAQAMTSEDVPEPLQDKRLVLLSASSLLSAGGSLEALLESILLELERAGNIVLAIEDLDQLVGVSSGGSVTLDAAEMIAQAVHRGSFRCIATSSSSSAKQYLERGAVATAFQRLEIQELDQEATRQILQSRTGNLEGRYGVVILLQAIDRAVELAWRYLHQQAMPGPALTLLEEAAVQARRRGKSAVVTGEDVAIIVSERTKVQVATVSQGEQDKLLHLEDHLHQRVVGQDEAITAVAAALRRARAELRDPGRPIATFLFIGPTGVGKTELAKAVAEVEFDSDKRMIRLDMSEYQDVQSIGRLLGTPEAPTAGLLTSEVRIHPFSLVLLDELEKAHSDVLNIFLQVFDDGRLTDAAGRTIDFTNTIIIATSNAGTPFIQKRLQEGVALENIKKELVEDVLQSTYRPEFLNRFDGIILFTPLSQEHIEHIVGMMLTQVAKRLTDRGISFTASPDAIRELAARGFDPLFGARPLRRAIQDHVDNALATALLSGKIGRRDTAILEPDGKVRIEKAVAVS